MDGTPQGTVQDWFLRKQKISDYIAGKLRGDHVANISLDLALSSLSEKERDMIFNVPTQVLDRSKGTVGQKGGKPGPNERGITEKSCFKDFEKFTQTAGEWYNPRGSIDINPGMNAQDHVNTMTNQSHFSSEIFSSGSCEGKKAALMAVFASLDDDMPELFYGQKLDSSIVKTFDSQLDPGQNTVSSGMPRKDRFVDTARKNLNTKKGSHGSNGINLGNLATVMSCNNPNPYPKGSREHNH
jgi:hypothetical protein